MSKVYRCFYCGLELDSATAYSEHTIKVHINHMKKEEANGQDKERDPGARSDTGN